MMDKESSSRLQELNNMQLKISYLFKELIKERNYFKDKSENLNNKLEQIYNETKNLKNEAVILKKQNETLTLNNDDMYNLIDRGIKILKDLDFSQENLIKEQKIALETLKRIFLECSIKIEKSKITHEALMKEQKKNELWQSDTIINEIEGLSNLNFCTEFFCDEELNKNSPNKDYILKKNSNTSSINDLKSTSDEEKKESELVLKSGFFSSELNTQILANISGSSQLSPEIESCLKKSPVFKDVGVRRHESLSSEESSSTSSISQSTKLINEKFLDRSSDFFLSPWKKSPHRGKEKSPSTPKRMIKRQLKINSPDRSPLLKKSNMREVEISFSGIRKLRQTFLNVDCYKKKSLENRENENGDCKNEDKTNTEDDDIISESPKKSDQVLEDIRNKKSVKELNNIPFITPPQTSDTDLDETYISSSLIRKNSPKQKHDLEVIEDRTPLKRHAREKSPEYDSVPFVYKREPVRKKAERMKLPGHACMECNKYYENAFDDIETESFQKILNKCSRHRDKNFHALDDTPADYWKPFLTCSTVISPNKNDASSKNSN